MSQQITQKATSLIVVGFAYGLAISIGLGFAGLSGTDHPLFVMALADVLAMLVIFGFSYGLDNSSVYDPYWSVIPICIGAYWLLHIDGITERKWMIMILVSYWGIRLTLNWAREWRSLDHQDWRYRHLQKKHRESYWMISFFGIHLLPTFLVFVAMIPVYYAMKSTAPLGVVDFIAAFVTFAAISIEFVADEQQWRFRSKFGSHYKFIMTGLWAYSRHPNYLGEILFWIGLFFFVPASGSNAYWTGLGAIAMILLFVFVSIPMMERRLLSSRSGYDKYQKTVSCLIPWFPGKMDD